jgi:putative sigma-54 modulation protein
MKLRLTGRHFEVTPHLRRHIVERFDRLERFDHGVIEGDVVLFKDRAFDVAEGKVHLGHTILTAKARGTDMYVAVNEMFDKVQTQLQRYESKLKTRKRSAERGV